MPEINKKAISEALIAAINREELHTRQAASYLNLNPCYLSMAQNPKSWDAMGKAPWVRLQEWFDTNEPLNKFQIPDGEEIWKPKEKPLEINLTAEGKKFKKAFEKVTKAHDQRVYERNLPDTESAEICLLKTQVKQAQDAYHTVLELNESLAKRVKDLESKTGPDYTRIPVQLDLRINVEMSVLGKLLNVIQL